MNIKTLPEDYSGTLAPVIYTLTGMDSEEIVEVAIMEEDGVTAAGIKRLHGETRYTVNTANYIQRRLNVEPASGSGYGFVYPTARTASSRIRIGSTLSPASIITGGSEKCPARKKISGAPGITTVTPDDRDEITFIAAPGNLTAKASFYGKSGSTTLELTSVTSPGGLCVLCGKLKNISGSIRFEDYDEMEIEVRDSIWTVATQRYKIVAERKSAVRTCWQNKYGQVDYYSFDLLEKSVKAEKSKVRVETGYETVGVSPEMSYTLVSQCEPGEMIEWLSGILSSPKVWMIEDGEAKPVDVTTSSTTLKGEGPQSLTLNMRRIVESNR